MPGCKNVQFVVSNHIRQLGSKALLEFLISFAHSYAEKMLVIHLPKTAGRKMPQYIQS